MSCLCVLAEVPGKEAGVNVMEIYSVFLGGLIGVAPYLAGWIAVIVLASLMLRRRGGRAEGFLVLGASLKLVSNLLNIPTAAIVPWLVQKGYNITYASSLASGYGILRGLVGMAAIICLIYAFWVKFKGGK